jgi:hypothetical protein
MPEGPHDEDDTPESAQRSEQVWFACIMLAIFVLELTSQWNSLGLLLLSVFAVALHLLLMTRGDK